MGSSEGGPAKAGCKGKNFIRVEEEQLCRSVMLVSQDRVVGNQQKAGVFWERITEHYNANRPDGVRPLRSLETKWGLIKHNVSKFCGIYIQVQRMQKSGSNAADTLRDAKELYRQKSAKNTEFVFEHCWLLLKDCPRWADGWTQSPMAKKRAAHEFEGSNTQAEDGAISESVARSHTVYNERPGGVKAAKQDIMQQKVREGALYAQAEATRSLAAVQMKKVALIEDQNMLLLMTMPIEENAGQDAHEYLRLRREEELKKLKKRLCAEESREHAEEESRVAAAEAERVGSRREEVPQEDTNFLDREGTAARGGGASDREGGLSRRGGEAEQRGGAAAGRAGRTPGRVGDAGGRKGGAAGRGRGLRESREMVEGGEAMGSGRLSSARWEGVSVRGGVESERGGMASERGEWDPEVEGRDWNAEDGTGVWEEREEEDVRGRSIAGDEGERRGGSPRSLREAGEGSGENARGFFFFFQTCRSRRCFCCFGGFEAVGFAGRQRKLHVRPSGLFY